MYFPVKSNLVLIIVNCDVSVTIEISDMTELIDLIGKYGLKRIRLLLSISAGLSLTEALERIGGCCGRNYGHLYALAAAKLLVIRSNPANRGYFGIGRAPRTATITAAGHAVLAEIRRIQLEGLSEGLRGEL